MEPYYDEGGITIYHGDCREILSELTADVVITDPPYGIDYEYVNMRPGKARGSQHVTGDDEPFDPMHLLGFARLMLFGANYYADKLPVGQWIVWNKRDRREASPLSADAELIWHNCGGYAVSVFNWFWVGYYRKGETGTPRVHPSQKPIALMRWLVENYSTAGQLVLDPYMGSGTTLRAALDVGRRAIGIEIEERYCEIAAKRLAQEVFDFADRPPAR